MAAPNIQVGSYGSAFSIQITITDFPNQGDSSSYSLPDHIETSVVGGRFNLMNEEWITLLSLSGAEAATFTVNGVGGITNAATLQSAILSAIP